MWGLNKDNIWATDLAEIASLSSKNQDVKYLLCVIDVLTKYAWVRPLKDKKPKRVLHDFIGIINESTHKPNRSWVDQGREFYNNLTQRWLDDNEILMDSAYNSVKNNKNDKIIIKSIKIDSQ